MDGLLSSNKYYEENKTDAIGICITDGGSGCVLGINQSYEMITNIEKHEICGNHASRLEQNGFIDHSAALMVLKRKISVTIEQTILRTSTKVDVIAYPILDHRGEITEIVSLVFPSKRSKLTYIEEQGSNLNSVYLSDDVTYRSKEMQQVILRAGRASLMDSTVLITGESGVGKEVVARLIHQQSLRKNKPFIKVNISAIPEGLFESELFGYHGGAFTGALKVGKQGLVQAANGGTLFLDEIGDIPLNTQVKLLRLLENKEAIPVGGVSPERLDVRFLAATNRDLPALIRAGQFREDLFFRLNVVPIHIPPLRERKDDICILAVRFLINLCNKYKVTKQFDRDALEVLTEYPWPGNVREVQNIIERLVALYPQKIITKEQVFNEIVIKLPIVSECISLQNGLQYEVDQFEKKLLEKAFQKNNFSMEQTADYLGMHRTTILRKLRKFGIQYQDSNDNK